MNEDPFKRYKGPEGEQLPHLEYMGRKFLGTYGPGQKDQALKLAQGHEGIVRGFGVKINQIDPATNEVLEGAWEMEEGFSVWK